MSEVRWHQEYEGGRTVAISGSVEIGAVFPGNPVRWRMWFGSAPAAADKTGVAPTELGARNQLLTAFEDVLRAAGLVEGGL